MKNQILKALSILIKNYNIDDIAEEAVNLYLKDGREVSVAISLDEGAYTGIRVVVFNDLSDIDLHGNFVTFELNMDNFDGSDTSNVKNEIVHLASYAMALEILDYEDGVPKHKEDALRYCPCCGEEIDEREDTI